MKKFKQLGNKKTQYKFDKPRSDLLETFEISESASKGFMIVPFTQERDEFTSLCPKTGQPDYAKLEIIYVPRYKMIESKSLKLYLFSFRNHGEFHEDVCSHIADDLFNLLNPFYLRVYGDFASRGGLSIKPVVERWGRLGTPEIGLTIRALVQSWDIKK